MENENKWEYDYSSGQKDPDTGYPNVGSSGANTANTAYNYGDDGPAGPAQPDPAAPSADQQPPRKKRSGNFARSAVSLLLAAAVGFVGGVVGAKVGGLSLIHI